MATEKKLKEDDVYLPVTEIDKRFGITRKLVYELYNKKKVRYIFKRMALCGQKPLIIYFNIDDIRKNIKKNGDKNYGKIYPRRNLQVV